MKQPVFVSVITLLLVSLAPLRAAEPGLVAHWNFDEGSGDIARDVSSHGHDATLKNVEWMPSPRGHALRFDSKASLARYGGLDSMNLSGDVTLAVWVKTDSTVAPHTHRLIFGDSGAGVQRNLHLSLDSYDRLSFEWADGKSTDSLLALA
ncbi:MAG: LamG domain-containing protein, partial [Verrucomicrobia bacterium]|nr:LamG domain-containing protein [Verrucomicrobiota bacterium]